MNAEAEWSPARDVTEGRQEARAETGLGDLSSPLTLRFCNTTCMPCTSRRFERRTPCP